MLLQPRPVQFRTILEVLNSRPVLFWLGVIFTILGIVLTVLFSIIFTTLDDDVPQVDYPAVMERGQTTTGTITDLALQLNETYNGVHPTIISYKYSANGHEVESKFKTLSTDEVERMQVGDEIPVKYLDGQSVIASLEPFGFPVWIFAIFPSSIFLIVGLSFSVYLYFFATGQIRLYQFGTVVEAQVVSMTHKSSRRNGRMSRIEVHYQYQSNRNQMLLGSALSSDMTLLNMLKQGDPLKIFVSPEDPSKSTMVPHLEVVRNGWKVE